MARTVLVVTDRPSFVATCQPIADGVGVALRVIPPASLAAELRPYDAVLFDAQSEALGDDELLVALGYARALLATAAVSSDASSALDELALELCPGLAATSHEALADVMVRLLRRSEGRGAARFEYVTVSPRDAELLVILSSGQAVLLPRPCGDADDGSEITGIDISADATRATLELERGGSIVLNVAAVLAAMPDVNGNQVPTAGLNGANVGARLRQLRKAAGLTQAELARRTGIHRPNIARVEAGRHTPSLDTLARIASAIGVSATQVLAAE